MGLSTQIGGVRPVEKNMIGSNQTGSWWCKQAKNVNQAKVFRAHAVPQGLCGNLINALKLLANQKEDGDGFIHSIVTILCEGSRKGPHGGVRKFIQVDNHRAPEVGHLSEGLEPSKYEAERRRRVPRGACLGKPRRN